MYLTVGSNCFSREGSLPVFLWKPTYSTCDFPGGFGEGEGEGVNLSYIVTTGE